MKYVYSWTISSKKDCGKNTKSASSTLHVHLIRNEERKGIGHAIRQGIQYALDKDFCIVVVLAGNNKDDPREISRLLEPIMKEDYDYVQGSRFLARRQTCKESPSSRSIQSILSVSSGLY